jgi:hypothetical protein
MKERVGLTFELLDNREFAEIFWGVGERSEYVDAIDLIVASEMQIDSVAKRIRVVTNIARSESNAKQLEPPLASILDCLGPVHAEVEIEDRYLV